MKTVAEITIPPCGHFSFMLPLPKGQSTDIVVVVDGRAPEVRKITDRVLRVLGSGAPGIATVQVGELGMATEFQATAAILTIGGSDYLIEAGQKSMSVTTAGVRCTVFLDWFDGAVVGTLEIANAEWTRGKHRGPVYVPPVSVRLVGDRAFTQTSGDEGILNPREHITRRFVLCDEAKFEAYAALSAGEHRIQCYGEWSYETIGAWGPQEITVSDLSEVPPIIELESRMIGGRSPLRSVGYSDGNEVGGFLVEYSYRPGLAGTELGKLIDLTDAMMERETIWAYHNGAAFDAESAAEAYGGEIPFRVEATNVPHLMIPNFYAGHPHDSRYPGNWEPGHLPEVKHGWKAHDGQHFVRPTSLLKSVVWNCGDQYAIHCLEQLAAHASLCKSHMPHRDAGWGDRTSTVYEMLNIAEGRGEQLGIGVGKREDAWLAEAIVMQDRLSPGGYAGRWQREYATVIQDNILPTGVGIQKGNHIVEQRAMGLTSGSGPKAEAAPGHEMIVPGMIVTQTFEAEHFGHLMFCMSRTEGLAFIGRFVVRCSQLIGGAHVPMGTEGRSGPYWYLNVADAAGRAADPIFASSGLPYSPFENWYGMGLHAYAAMLNESGPHFGFLQELYGGGDVDASLPAVSSQNHLDRMQAMLMAFNPPSPIVLPPDPEPEIDWEAKYNALVIRSRSIITSQQRLIEELTQVAI